MCVWWNLLMTLKGKSKLKSPWICFIWLLQPKESTSWTASSSRAKRLTLCWILKNWTKSPLKDRIRMIKGPVLGVRSICRGKERKTMTKFWCEKVWKTSQEICRSKSMELQQRFMQICGLEVVRQILTTLWTLHLKFLQASLILIGSKLGKSRKTTVTSFKNSSNFGSLKSLSLGTRKQTSLNLRSPKTRKDYQSILTKSFLKISTILPISKQVVEKVKRLISFRWKIVFREWWLQMNKKKTSLV